MSTRDWSEELTAYIDGELNEADRAALEAQLQVDESLRAMEQQLRLTVETMKLLSEPQTSPAMRRQVLAAIETPTFGERVRSFFSPGRLVSAGALAAAAVTVGVVMTRVDSGATPETEEQLFVASNIDNLDMLEDLDVVGVEQPDDLDVIANLHELNQGTP